MNRSKLAICCNFSHRSVGGSELVIKHISERLVKSYKYEVNVYSYSCKEPFVENGVNYVPCKKGIEFIYQISHNDHIMVYSDSFWGFDTLVENIDKVDCGVSVALVGAYHMQSHPKTFDILKKSIDKFNFICHSEGIDHKWCKRNDLDHTIIPNGVCLAEFKENKVNFREKYDIKEKYVILSVSNYFYGKGQEILPRISRKLSEKMDNFVILSISNTVQYFYDKIFFERTKKQSKGLNIKFLRDLPREDVIAAFHSSDMFLFPSRKEVAPLVILESRAAKLPYISMNVGNVKEHPGGDIISVRDKDKKGYAIVDNIVVNQFAKIMRNVLIFPELKKQIVDSGQKGIKRLDWGNIVPLYDEVFRDGD